MSAEHTPGELERNEIKGWELWIGANYHIADVHGQLYARRANALHLCRCWNSHDALLEACMDMTSFLNGLHFGSCIDTEEKVNRIRAFEKAGRAAIAQAE